MKRTVSVKRIASLLIGLVFIYILSEGLAWRLLEKEEISQSAYSNIYFPIVFYENHIPYFGYVMWRYDNLWYDEDKEFFKSLEDDLKKKGIYGKK
jgi:hypothetical protein